jgi:hypothetical protein
MGGKAITFSNWKHGGLPVKNMRNDACLRIGNGNPLE